MQISLTEVLWSQADGVFVFSGNKIPDFSALVVFLSELAKHLPRLGALIAALPTLTILILIWLYIESQPQQRWA